MVNYDKSSKGGSHWVACVKNGDILYHFGSHGIPPLTEIKGHFSNNHVHYNDRAVQLNDSAICGHLCLAFIEWMILDNSNKIFYKIYRRMFKILQSIQTRYNTNRTKQKRQKINKTKHSSSFQ